MPAREILLYGDPRLEQPCEPVEEFDSDLSTLVDDLFATSWKIPGLGVAAPQIGIGQRLAVVDISVGEDPSAQLVFANPEIVESTGRITLEEGCLSFPGLFTKIERPRGVTVAAQDLTGKRFEIEAEGLLAQALCHELDHLDGVLLVHHLRGLKRRMFLRRVDKMRRLGAWPGTLS
ncbi:MAG: peptide deformylase [bacterium]|nr:peptide deformylase [bacterium]